MMAKELSKKEREISENAKIFVKKNKKALVERFSPDSKYLPNRKIPTSVFMAGSPGAGKTEMAKRFLESFDESVLRIDPDEIRNVFHEYTGKNAYLFQGATSFAAEYLQDDALYKDKHFIFDSTLSEYSRAKMNIERSLSPKRKQRSVAVIYIHTDPQAAWDFTQAREEKEGRRIDRKVFIERFISARETFRKINKDYRGRITTLIFVKSYKIGFFIKQSINPKDIDSILPHVYSKHELNKLLK